MTFKFGASPHTSLKNTHTIPNVLFSSPHLPPVLLSLYSDTHTHTCERMRNTRILSCLRAHTHTHNLLISLASLLIATLGRNEKGFQLIILFKIDSFAFIPSSFPLLPLGPLQHSITLAPPVSCDSITLMNLFF